MAIKIRVYPQPHSVGAQRVRAQRQQQARMRVQQRRLDMQARQLQRQQQAMLQQQVFGLPMPRHRGVNAPWAPGSFGAPMGFGSALLGPAPLHDMYGMRRMRRPRRAHGRGIHQHAGQGLHAHRGAHRPHVHTMFGVQYLQPVHQGPPAGLFGVLGSWFGW